MELRFISKFKCIEQKPTFNFTVKHWPFKALWYENWQRGSGFSWRPCAAICSRWEDCLEWMALEKEVSGHCAAKFALQPHAGQSFLVKERKALIPLILHQWKQHGLWTLAKRIQLRWELVQREEICHLTVCSAGVSSVTDVQSSHCIAVWIQLGPCKNCCRKHNCLLP